MKKNYRKQILKGALCIFTVLCLVFSSRLNAQTTAAVYSFAPSTTTFSYLSSGTSVSTLLSDDTYSGAIPIGFTFNYCGTNYTNVYAGSNGWLSFSALVSSYSFNSSGTLSNTLFPLWDDLDGSSGSATYATTGTAPNRVFTMEWKNWQWNYSATGVTISFQVLLFETNNKIQFIYKQESGSVNSPSATIGISGVPAADFQTLDGTGTSPSSSTSVFTTSLSTKPADGQIYQFTPPPPCSTPVPGATVATPSTLSCLGKSTILSFGTLPIASGYSYQWQSSPDGVTYTGITGATSATYVATPISPTWYKCLVTCSTGPSTVESTPVQVLFASAAPTTTSGVRCGTGAVTLSAATSISGTTLRWYPSLSGGSPLASGTTYTPTVSSTTTYYVGAETGGTTTGTGARPAPAATTGTTPSSYGLVFNASSDFTLNSVDVYSATSAGTFVIQLQNSSGTPIYTSGTFTLPVASSASTPFTASLGWNITIGTGYRILIISGTASLVRESALGGYPYSIGTVGSITSGYISGTSSTYYFMYNWNYTAPPICSTPRTLVTATVNTPPTFSIAGSQTACNNAAAMMNVTSSLASFNSYVWTPSANLYTDAACTVPYVAGASASTVYAKTTTAGTITYTCTANNSTTLCASTATAIVTTLPSSVTVIATPANICNSGATNLSISPATTTFGGATWQWASSADNIMFNDSLGMTGATLRTNTLSFRRYYRITLKNSAGAFCLNSTSDTALVLIPAITSVTGAASCGTGTLTLGATAVDGTINWYAAASGGSSLATGTSYTTPSLTTTTTYYVGAIATPNFSAQVGTGTLTNSITSYPTPFGNYYGSSHDQYLITAAELTIAGFSAGSFSSIAFDLATSYTFDALSNFQILMAPTTATSLTTTLISSGFTTVVPSTTYTPPASTGYAAIPFTNKFIWDGVSNIVVDVSFSNCSSCTGTSSCVTSYTNNGTVNQTSTSYVSTVTYYADDNCTINTFTPSGGTSSNTYSQRPNMRFIQNGCETGTRTPVTATINTIPTVTATATPAVVCAGYSTTLTGGGTPIGTTYTWSGGVTNGVAFTPSSTGTYTVTGTSPAGCQATANVTVTVNPAPIVSTTPLGTYTVCADSGVMLRSTYSSAGLAFQWYNGATPVSGATNDSLLVGGASGGSGTYTLKVSLGTCSAQSTPGTTVIVNPLPTPSVSPSGTLNVCSTTPTTLTGTGTGNYQWCDASGPISGATGTTYTPSVTGAYKLLLTNPYTGCRKLTLATNVNITPTPTVSISPSLSKVCIDSFAALTSVHSAGFGTGNVYQWYNGTTPVSAPEGTADYYTHTTPGVYTLKVTNNGLCSTTSNTATVIVNPLPASSFTKTGTTGAICLGSTMELTALTIPTGSKYQWMLNGMDISGANGQRYYAPVGGVYTVRIIDSNNCRKISDTLSLINTPMPVPIPSPLNARFCEGDIIRIYANAGPYAVSFKWTKNGSPLPDISSSITTATSGIFSVRVMDIYGCNATSPNATIAVDLLPSKPVITKIGRVLTTTTPYSTYQWYRNGKLIAGATYSSYTLLFDGDYHVVVTNSTNCNNVSDTISIQGLSVKQISSNSINVAVYPNPSQDLVNIDAPVEVNLYVKDIQGKQILELKNAKQVDMAAYADGIYIFTITDKEGMVLKMDKVVKKTN
ncbi:MAG: T9SS type A sorting domain-containing protein [Phycisphaerales bacterium]|nr:T9SS type A sorting domain-containing protein [Phycisphaerales bacterium]